MRGEGVDCRGGEVGVKGWVRGLRMTEVMGEEIGVLFSDTIVVLSEIPRNRSGFVKV